MPFDSASQELCDLLAKRLGRKSGAGEGNRTLVASLEGWSFTTKLHPRSKGHHGQQSLRCQFRTDYLFLT